MSVLVAGLGMVAISGAPAAAAPDDDNTTPDDRSCGTAPNGGPVWDVGCDRGARADGSAGDGFGGYWFDAPSPFALAARRLIRG